MRKATQQQTKEFNRNLVLRMIFEQDSISRAEIARITKLTRTTVSDIVADLLEEGLVSEVGVGQSKGGKSPILLSLREDSRCLIGLDLAHNQFRGAVVNLRGKIHSMVTLPLKDHNGEEALALVYEILDHLVDPANRALVGIGIGTPGLVNTSDGVVVDAVNLDWKNLPLAGLVQERYRLPVYVLNDSQAAAIGEYTYGNGPFQNNNLVVINAMHGIGAGIVINGHLFQGDGGGAGEIGHISVVGAGGLPCRCGNRGCLETVASVQALLKQARLLAGRSAYLPMDPQEISLEAIEQAFTAGDPLVQEMVFETSRYMGLAISILIGTLNIQKIVLTGDMTCFGKPWLEAARETISHSSLSNLAKNTRVEFGHLGGNGIILGACALLANNYDLLFKRVKL